MATRVLVVEDDLEINELLGEYLALENMRYLKAVTGGAGIHMALSEHPDAMILDLMLPDVDGFEVARQITGHRATYDIPVIILSCMCQEQDKEKGYSNGALFFTNKPFLPDDLLATVRQALAWRAELPTRTPAGTFRLGVKAETAPCARGFNQMVADLFARTELDDATVEQMRAAMELLNGWAHRWNAERAPALPAGGSSRRGIKVDYEITAAAVTWRLTEETPGLLAETFFTSRAKPSGGIGASLKGWGGSAKPQGPAPVPAAWMELLAKTGAPYFEKDSQARTLRLVRALRKSPLPVEGAGDGVVPVVEMTAQAPAAAGAVTTLAPAST